MIKAEVTYTKKHLTELAKKGRNIASLITVLYIILVILLSIIAIRLLHQALGKSSYSYGKLVFLAVLIIAEILRLNFFIPNNNYKSYAKKYPGAVIHITLNNDCISAETSGEGFSESVELSYDKMVCAVEVSDFFFIYPTKNTAYIIGKDELTEGTPEELSTLLTDKLGKKFKIKN